MRLKLGLNLTTEEFVHTTQDRTASSPPFQRQPGSVRTNEERSLPNTTSESKEETKNVVEAYYSLSGVCLISNSHLFWGFSFSLFYIVYAIVFALVGIDFEPQPN